jgi:hypothetical protein
VSVLGCLLVPALEEVAVDVVSDWALHAAERK